MDAAPVPAEEPGGTAGLPGGLHGPGHLATQLLPASGEHTQGRIVTTCKSCFKLSGRGRGIAPGGSPEGGEKKVMDRGGGG